MWGFFRPVGVKEFLKAPDTMNGDGFSGVVFSPKVGLHLKTGVYNQHEDFQIMNIESFFKEVVKSAASKEASVLAIKDRWNELAPVTALRAIRAHKGDALHNHHAIAGIVLEGRYADVVASTEIHFGDDRHSTICRDMVLAIGVHSNQGYKTLYRYDLPAMIIQRMEIKDAVEFINESIKIGLTCVLYGFGITDSEVAASIMRQADSAFTDQAKAEVTA